MKRLFMAVMTFAAIAMSANAYALYSKSKLTKVNTRTKGTWKFCFPSPLFLSLNAPKVILQEKW